MNRLAKKFASMKEGVNALAGAVQDPQFYSDMGNNARVLAGFPSAQGLPNDDDLAKMDWSSLVALRNKFTGQDQQNVLAPYEHRAYAREFTDTPMDAAKMALFSAGYTPYKAAMGEGRSQPSIRAIGQGLLGTWEGLNR